MIEAEFAAATAAPPVQPGGQAPRDPPSQARSGHRYLRRPHELIPGNSVRILHNGAQAFPRMLEAIAGAAQSVDFEVYTFAHDRTGREFGEALRAAAARGVRVRLLFDAVGTWGTKKEFLRWLEQGGIEVRIFRPFWPGLWNKLKHLSDHRKLMVVDGARAYVGGMNIADEWAPTGKAWRDVMAEIEGPAARALEQVFVDSWRSQDRQRLRTARRGPLAGRRTPVRPGLPGGDIALGILAARKAIHDAYVHAIERARESVLITAGYFVPDARLLAAIRGARERGVEVSIILPGKSDHFLIHAAGRAFYERLLSWGVSIYEWWDQMLHAKVAVVDGVWTTVGSFNLDSWSRFHNVELNVVVADPAFGRRLHEEFSADARRSVLVVRETWSRRPWRAKLSEAFAYLIRRWL